ncbi:MAG: hypothetical protein ACSHX9_16655 [Luteolibacter sp.]
MPAIEFEPVTPDPKKNYRTALILLVVMIVGGIVILKAYNKRTKEAEADDRPSFVTQISETKDLMYMQQDGELKELMELKGKVILVQVTPKSAPDSVTTGVMRRFSEAYAEEEDFVMLTLMLDPGDAEGLEMQLKEFSEELGAELPKWTVASNERPTLHKFVKNEFKANMLPHEKDGEWVYDHSLVLIDKNRHVRKAVVPQKQGGASFVVGFDFEQAMKWDEEGIKTGTELNNTEQLEVLLNDTLGILLAENIEQKEQSSKAVVVAVSVGLGFLVMLILIRMRSKSKSQAA